MSLILIITFVIIERIYFVYQSIKAAAASNGRTTGSENARDGAHPHQVSLRYQGKHDCGGSIVDEEWIITAAHCVYGILAKNLTIVAGSNKLDTGGKTYKVLEVYCHEGYNPNTNSNDIAFLKVEKIAFNEKVNKIPVKKDYVSENEPLILTGWGSTVKNGSLPDDLQYVRFKSTNMQECMTTYADQEYRVNSTFICAVTKPGAGACFGDSGGPLITEDVDGKPKLVGVTSFGNRCISKPDVFVRISQYIPWLNEICKNCL